MSVGWDRAKANFSKPRRMPDLLTMREVQGIFRLTKTGMQGRLRRVFRPMGGVVYAKPGTTLGPALIHAWAVQRCLNMMDRCPGCGKKYDTIEGDDEVVDA